MKTNIQNICQKAKAASREFANIDARTRTGVIRAMSRELISRARHIESENKKDILLAGRNGLSEAMIDRLRLTPDRIKAMAESLDQIARSKDPVGSVMETVKRPNGLLIKKVRVPIGVILIIYESRPNVTSDCAGLCLRGGNAVILRGGKEALHSNIAIYKALSKACARFKLPEGLITLVDDPDRKLVDELLVQDGSIDLVMPRGGESLIRSVTEKSRMPVIKHYKGVCHVYVDKSADLKMAEEISFNAKVQRPGVCNAMETLLVHEAVAKRFLPAVVGRLKKAGVEIRGCDRTRRIVSDILSAHQDDWYAEYLDLILAVKVVKDIDEAISHIMKYGSYHSDAIITKDKAAAEKFLKKVDSACVYVNASTRFTDGGEFGKGAEVGISTDKIHARGPMGVTELTSYKYIIYGQGQVRK